MDEVTKQKAEEEFRELRVLYGEKERQRTEELRKKNVFLGLDGPDYWKDINDWYKEELDKLKKKYGINK